MIRRILAVALAALPTALAGTMVEIRMPIGTIGLELFDLDKPVTVSNFLSYISSGRYVDSFAHRLVPGFVLQGGGFVIDSSNTIQSVPTFGAIQNEYASGTIHSNTLGTIAMARLGGSQDSATSQWFINLSDNTGLDFVDGGFTVFGHAIYALDANGTPYASTTTFLNAINSAFADGDPANYVVRDDFASPFNELPALYDPLTTALPLNSLVYTHIVVVPEPAVPLLLALALVPLYPYRSKTSHDSRRT